jgi:hypothetical protein
MTFDTYNAYNAYDTYDTYDSSIIHPASIVIKVNAVVDNEKGGKRTKKAYKKKRVKKTCKTRHN